MAKMVLTAGYLNITGAGDISSLCEKIELTAEVEKKEVTTYGSSGWKEVLGGLGSGQLSVKFKQDLVSGGLDEDMWTLFLTKAPVAFEVRLTQSAVSTSNPKYTGTVLISEWSPISGSVGDVAEVEVDWDTSAAITRATA